MPRQNVMLRRPFFRQAGRLTLIAKELTLVLRF
ncbi:hypothetical protein MED193_08853 [Roseobacter sp. MED193]|nr:hypothetical protein MED193_08853 [Roseobacter sp. MED193]